MKPGGRLRTILKEENFGSDDRVSFKNRLKRQQKQLYLTSDREAEVLKEARKLFKTNSWRGRICGIGVNITETQYLSDARRNSAKKIRKWHCVAGLLVVGIKVHKKSCTTNGYPNKKTVKIIHY